MVTKNMGVCANHFNKSDPMKKSGMYMVPAVPPSLFNNDIPKSCQGTPPPKPRQTSKSSTAARNIEIDQEKDFRENDSLKLLNFKNIVMEKLPKQCNIAWIENTNSFIIMSKSRNGPISDFVVYILVLSMKIICALKSCTMRRTLECNV